MKKFVTKQEIEQARQLDLLSYLQRYEPDELVKVAPDVYSTRSNDSLKISNGRYFRNGNATNRTHCPKPGEKYTCKQGTCGAK